MQFGCRTLYKNVDISPYPRKSYIFVLDFSSNCLYESSGSKSLCANFQAFFTFSDLQSVYFNSPIKGLLKHLSVFSKLKKVKLSKVNSEDVEDLVTCIGNGLIHIELVCIRGSLNLSVIASKCPQLKILEIFYSMAVHVSTPLNFRFPKLHKLIIYSTDIHGFDAQQVLFSFRIKCAIFVFVYQKRIFFGIGFFGYYIKNYFLHI